MTKLEFLKSECEKLKNPYTTEGRRMIAALDKGTEKALLSALTYGDIKYDLANNPFERAHNAYLNYAA